MLRVSNCPLNASLLPPNCPQKLMIIGGSKYCPQILNLYHNQQTGQLPNQTSDRPPKNICWLYHDGSRTVLLENAINHRFLSLSLIVSIQECNSFGTRTNLFRGECCRCDSFGNSLFYCPQYSIIIISLFDVCKGIA